MTESALTYRVSFHYSVNVSQFMLVKLAAKSEMPVGNFTASNMVFNPMVKCPLTKQLEEVMTHSTLFSLKLELESTYQEQYLSISNPP